MTLEAKLQKLIELWWTPSGEGISNPNYKVLSEYSLNDLCSIDSGLRQFVCQKWYIKLSNWVINYNRENRLGNWKRNIYYTEHKEYRIMLSSIQEDKEKFLLENIVLPTT